MINKAMIIELIVFFTLFIAGLISMFLLKRELRRYDGMGEVRKDAPGRSKPAEKVL